MIDCVKAFERSKNDAETHSTLANAFFPFFKHGYKQMLGSVRFSETFQIFS